MNYCSQRDKTIILKESRKISQFFIENIVYIECDSYLSIIHLNNTNKAETFSVSLKEFEKKFNDYCFFRVNRNILLNMKYFKSLVNSKTRHIAISNGEVMKVSRRNWHFFKLYIDA